MGENAKQTILIVDDHPMNRALLTDMLSAEFDILGASNGVDALTELHQHGTGIALVLLDIVMPQMDGLEVLAAMNAHGWIQDIPVIMVSSETSATVVQRAYDLGATDFIDRPFDTSIVWHRVTNTLVLCAKQKALEDMVRRQIIERERSVSQMISILSQIVEFRNGESGLHVLHVNTMTELLLRQVAKKSDHYQLSPADIEAITMASSLHDIGKISIPEEVLNKPGRLTDEEFALMKQHSMAGAEMLYALPDYGTEPFLQTAAEICRWHHERYDGRGYPDGLTGDDIPLSAQVVALADVYDALTSQRVYKDACPHEQAMQMILDGECGAFNPFLLECLQDIEDEVQRQMASPSPRVRPLAGPRPAAANPVASTLTAVDAGPAPSGRTLDLLEYERMKFDFFAKMSNEILFECTADPPLLMMSAWGTDPLGLPETMLDPASSPQLQEMVGADNLAAFQEAIRATTPDDPIRQFDFQATVQGEPRWFHLAARARWEEGEDGLAFCGWIGKLVDVHESRKLMSELERRATHDALTGLTNHDFARKLITERMAEHPDGAFMLMVVDMDLFKQVNDTHGHLMGDEVLKELARRLRASVRGDDIVARVGGDEFLICMKCAVDPHPLADRVYHGLIGEHRSIPISVSVGAAVAKGADTPYDELFAQADAAMYQVKRACRGGCAFAEAETCNGAEPDATLRTGQAPSLRRPCNGADRRAGASPCRPSGPHAESDLGKEPHVT